MNKFFYIFFGIIFFSPALRCQDDCGTGFTKDTMSFFTNKQVLDGEYLETTLKKLSVVRIFKTNDEKFYLRLIVTENFYFNKVDVLEVRSGNKSYYVKNAKQYKVDKTHGLYEFEVFKNYLAQLKEDGITSIYFGGNETDFTRQDAGQIKKMFKCFFEAVYPKK